MELSLNNLTKKYDNVIAVKSLNFTMARGVYGLLGVNGAGKTTLMRMICTLIQPSEGDITFDGRDISAMGGSYRQLLGYLPQNFGYYPDLTVFDYMMYIASIKGLKPVLAKKRTNSLLEQVGMEESSKTKMRKLSGGMLRRVGIAQAMLNDPRILILDEPTVGLDPNERIRFRNLISELSEDRLVLLSTHIVSDVEYIAKEILLLRRGTLVMQGTPRELEQSIQGKVWEVSVNEADMALMVDTYCVSNIKQQDGSYLLRIVDDGKPLRGAKPVSPNLDDVFLQTFFQPSEGQP